MTILERLSRLIRANLNDLISKAEDPGKVIDQALRDMRDAYAQARSEVADAMAQNVKLEREASRNRTLATEYASKAQEALQAGREDLAREALRRRRNHEDLAAGFDDQLTTQTSTVDHLKTQLRALEAKIDELDSRKELLQARAQGAKASQTLERVSGFDKGTGAVGAFEEMERRVQEQEDRAHAMKTMREEGDIDTQLQNLGRDAEIDAELARLKRDMGMGGQD